MLNPHGLLTTFFWGFSAHAISVIRDTEIEETVTGWAKKIFKGEKN